MTATTPRRAPGRPMDPELAQRFITGGIELIAEQGLHRLNTDVLAARIHAGKAGFYRRWPDVDHFLADVTRYIAAAPVDYPEPRTTRTDLAALVLHQVCGDVGLVRAALLARLPYSPVLAEAWADDDGPAGQLFLASERVMAGQTAMPCWFAVLHRRIVGLVAELLWQRLTSGVEPSNSLVRRAVDLLLDDVDRIAKAVA